MPVDKIRAIGISQSKANYIRNVSEFIVERNITARKLHKMTDDEIVNVLYQGFGAQMLLILGFGDRRRFGSLLTSAFRRLD